TLLVDFTGNTCPGAGVNHITATGRSEYWTVSRNQLLHAKALGVPTMEFATLSRSVIERNWCDPKDAPGQAEPTPHVRVTGSAEESEIAVPRREAFAGTLVRSKLTALNDGGVRREFLGAGGEGGTVLNFTPTDTAKIAKPKAGDVALDDGTNTRNHKPGLAVFDGKEWSYAN
ncbi:MAG TPA: hypothetical protein VF796_07170, partial [Humisphaera sp.]